MVTAMTSPLDLDDRDALRDLAARYALACDTRDFDALAHVFAPDAALRTGTSERTGMAEILTAMQGLLRYEATSHMVGQQVVDATSDGATGITYCTAHHLTVEGDTRTDKVMHIRYHDRFVRTDGGWRIAARRLEIVWTDERAVS
jgi:uncharacterized protein (TIGR02246 family)